MAIELRRSTTFDLALAHERSDCSIGSVLPRVAYLLAQSVLVAAWWLALVLKPETRDWFRPSTAPDEMLLSFWLADLACIVMGSALAAVFVRRRDPRRVPALWFIAGAMVYATLYCIAVTAMTGESALGVALMLPATVKTLAIARAESRS